MNRVLHAVGLAVLSGVIAIAPLGCGKSHASPGEAPAGFQVKIDNFTFAPATLTVPVGTKVVWTNHDDIPHTVVENDQMFKSKTMDTDEQFSYTFDKAGNFSYFCSLHPKMT